MYILVNLYIAYKYWLRNKNTIYSYKVNVSAPQGVNLRNKSVISRNIQRSMPETKMKKTVLC